MLQTWKLLYTGYKTAFQSSKHLKIKNQHKSSIIYKHK